MRAPMKTSRARLPLWLAVGHFILRIPARLARMGLPEYLARIAAEPRADADFPRIARILRRWLRQPGFRAANTCYIRSLIYFRFVNPHGRDLCLHFGVDQPSATDNRLHGHAWVSLDGVPWNAPASLRAGKLREIYRYSTLTGGSSTSGAAVADAMIHARGPAPATAPPPTASPASARAAAASESSIAPIIPRMPHP